MSSQRYSPEFKDDAVRQVVERGYSVVEVPERLGVPIRPREVHLIFMRACYKVGIN